MTKTILSTIMLSTILLTSLIATSGIQIAHADTENITIRSDSSNTFLAGPVGTPFTNVFTAADFAAASSGSNAYEITNHNAWVPHLSVDPTGKYIGVANVNPNHFGPNFQLITALYAVDFEITSDSIDSATLDIHFLVDNNLGWVASQGFGGATNEGIFINGQPVVGTTLPINVCGFCSEHSFTGLDISGLVNPGTNTLYVYASDYGQPSGVQYLANISVESTSVIPVEIDIKPGSDENPVNTKSQGVIPVAVLSTADFDAIDIDVSTVTFGPLGAPESHGTGHIEDVNGDGLNDLVLHFKIQETGIAKGDTEATLTGATFDGTAIEGSDIIRTN